jgi:hypothetical protein
MTCSKKASEKSLEFFDKQYLYIVMVRKQLGFKPLKKSRSNEVQKPQSSLLKGVASTLTQGFAFGAGSSVAHATVGGAIDKMFQNSDSATSNNPNSATDPCRNLELFLADCVQRRDSQMRDDDYCAYLSNLVKQKCQLSE